MTNARNEFESTIEDHTVLCAWIQMDNIDAVLRRGYSDSEYEEFLKELEVEYDAGYGTQKLSGTIWLDNGEWFDRHEYDGSEYWIHRSRPEILAICGKEDSATKSSSKA